MEILDSRLLCCDRSGVGDTTVVECGLGVGFEEGKERPELESISVSE